MAFTGPEHLMYIAVPLIKAREAFLKDYGREVKIDIEIEAEIAGRELSSGEIA